MIAIAIWQETQNDRNSYLVAEICYHTSNILFSFLYFTVESSKLVTEGSRKIFKCDICQRPSVPDTLFIPHTYFVSP